MYHPLLSVDLKQTEVKHLSKSILDMNPDELEDAAVVAWVEWVETDSPGAHYDWRQIEKQIAEKLLSLNQTSSVSVMQKTKNLSLLSAAARNILTD